MKKHHDRVTPSFPLLILLFTLSCTYSFSVYADYDEDLDLGQLIIDNTAGNTKWGLFANLEDLFLDCSVTSRVPSTPCIGITGRLERRMQVIQNNEAGVLTNMVGENNTAGVMHSVTADNQRKLFEDGKHLFPLDKYRDAADKIALLSPGNGTMSYEQFISKVASAIPMYGIIRVKIPVYKAVDGYRLCGRASCANICGPRAWEQLTGERSGGRVSCGSTLNVNSRAIIYGALLMDIIDVETDEPVPLSQMPENLSAISFRFDIPLKINPAANNNPTTVYPAWVRPSRRDSFVLDSTIENIKDIGAIAGSNMCPDRGLSCNYPIESAIPFSLIPQESKDRFEYKMGKTLTNDVFSSLPKDQQFNLLMPSGYENGWLKAFTKLEISANTWRDWGFKSPILTGTYTIDDIRSSQFEDIPALMLSGGVLQLHSYVSISGLVYANSLNNYINGASKEQYYNGGMIVRDSMAISFYSSYAKMVISNNPDTYSNIELLASPLKGKFKRVRGRVHPDVATLIAEGGDVSRYRNTGQVFYDEKLNAANNPGPQWIEIKPQ